MLVSLGLQIHIRRPPFRYFSYWAEHPNFVNLVAAAWNTQVEGSYQFRVVKKLKILKAELKTLNSTEFANLSVQTVQAPKHLQQVQRNLLLRQGEEELKLRSCLH